MPWDLSKPVNKFKHDANIKWNQHMIKLQAFEAYGGVRCNCCGLEEFTFLCMDHINHNGAAHRKEKKCGRGIQFYYWLKRNNYPTGFQVLCYNCNQAREFGPCPHAIREV